MILTHQVLFGFWKGASDAVQSIPMSFGGTVSPVGIFAHMPRWSPSGEGGGAAESNRVRPFIANVNLGMNR